MIEWVIFLALALIAIVTAAGMLVTMSMVRAGLALMSCFIALAGLFVLLDADLLAVIQVMKNVGGMLVMILFMVMAMMDPGGEMMWDMKRKMHLRGPGALSMRMPAEQPEQAMHSAGDHAKQASYTCPMHPEVRQDHPGRCPKCGMDLVPVASAKSDSSNGPQHDPSNSDKAPDGEMHAMAPMQHHQMMMDMAMSTAQLPWALGVGMATAVVLGILAVRTAWPVSGGLPTQDAANAVGELLLSRYMIAFEGAALLILAGIAGAVIFGKRERAPGVAMASDAMSQAQGEDGGDVFTCPMHPEVHAAAPGKCPKCGMALVRATDARPIAGGGQ